MDTTDPLLAALAARVGADRAGALLTRLAAFSNYPNTIKGAAKMPSDPEIEGAALALVQAPDLEPALVRQADPGLGTGPGLTQEGWGLLTLAARAEVGVLETVPPEIAERGADKIATIRRAAAKHRATIGSAGAATQGTSSAGSVGDDAPDVPRTVSAVSSWVAARPDVDPVVLAPHEGQKAAARRAAVRALGLIGTPRALEVLGQYAQESYPDADLAELHRAWGRFDRRAFAATMFRQAPWTLDLGVCATIEGIGAAPGLTSLSVVLTGGADLAPVAECTGLRTLRVGAHGSPGLLTVEPLLALRSLTELHLTGTTHAADLTPLAQLPVERLRLDLDGADGGVLLEMTGLRSLLLSGGSTPDDSPGTVQEGQPGPAPAHPDLPGVLLRLVARGVDVVVYRHERSWVTGLLAAAEAADGVHVVEQAGRIGLTREASAVEDLRRRLFNNMLP